MDATCPKCGKPYVRGRLSWRTCLRCELLEPPASPPRPVLPGRTLDELSPDELRALFPGSRVEEVAHCLFCGGEFESFNGHVLCFACWFAWCNEEDGRRLPELPQEDEPPRRRPPERDDVVVPVCSECGQHCWRTRGGDYCSIEDIPGLVEARAEIAVWVAEGRRKRNGLLG